MRKYKRHEDNPDVSRFQPLIDEALIAFGIDARFAIEMARTANTVEKRRKTVAMNKHYKNLTGHKPPRGWNVKDAIDWIEWVNHNLPTPV